MKKCLLLATALLLSTGVFAQRFEWGPKVGLGAVWESNSDVVFGGASYAGVVGEFVLSKHFGIQGELMYVGNWTRGNSPDNWGWLPDIDYYDDYIQLPVLAKIYFVRGLSLDIGPRFGYLTQSSVWFDGERFNRYREMNKFDAAAVIGASYKIAGRIDITARFNIGLTNKYKYSEGKNVSFQTGIGYRFK